MGKEIQKLSISALKPHPRNNEFFDDIKGEDYEQFKQSIQNDGILTPLIVASDMTVVSGHQRLRAAQDLGIEKVPVFVQEDMDSDDQKLKALLAANFGRAKNDEVKKRKVIAEYVSLCGYGHGEMGRGGEKRSQSENSNKLTLNEIAKQLGISKGSLTRSLTIERNLTDEMKELLDTGALPKTLAADTIASMDPKDQEELYKQIIELPSVKKIREYDENLSSGFSKEAKADIKQEVSSYIEQLQKKEMQLGTYQTENEELKEELKSKESYMKQEQQKFKSTIASYEAQIKDMQSSIKTVEVDRPETLQQIQELEQSVIRLQDELKEKKGNISKLIDQIKVQNSVHGELLHTMDKEIITNYSKIISTVTGFLQDMSLYEYRADAFKSIPIEMQNELKLWLNKLIKWGSAILQEIEVESNIIDIIQ